ncbi:MAG: tetratricopeptide repeat protein, partial [Armatimonadetes bacterium]|nr:tetratricopeptide repeat protein [Armatimonadota bacterium]
KPDNLYLLPDGTVKLTDFGIARIMGEPSLTGAGQVFGTPSYMSPEQIAGKPVDERTDLYSLGVMAYEMLTGRKPFVGENVVALTYQILNVEPSPPPGIPPDLGEFVRKGMAKESADRFQSSRQMIDALRSLPSMGGAPVMAPSGSPATVGGGPATVYPDPNLPPGFPTGLPGNTPTYPPGAWMPRRRFTLSEGARQFLLALAGGVLLGTLIVVGMLGVRNAYEDYAKSFRVKAGINLYNQALDAYKQGRYREAARDFEIVTRRARGTELETLSMDGMVQSYLHLGNAEMGRDLNKAESFFQQAIKADPSYARSYLYLGDVLERKGHFQSAIETWQRAVDLDGFGEVGSEARRQMSIAYYNRGVAAFNVNDRPAAREYWQKAIEVDPAGPIARRAEESIGRLYTSPFPGM